MEDAKKSLVREYNQGKAYVPEPAVLLSMAETMSNEEIAGVTGIAVNLMTRKLRIARQLSNLPEGRKKRVDKEGKANYPVRIGLEMDDGTLAAYRQLIAEKGGYRKFAKALGVSHGAVYKPVRERYLGRSMIDRIKEKTGVNLG